MSHSVENASSEAYENQHVHQVYEQIASHFSETRYKPWPVVACFLQGLRPGSVGLDVGCGNGKNLGLNHGVFILGSDRSESLVNIASSKGAHRDCVVADGLALPHPNSRFDFAISIAVVHHFATRARRVAAIEAILATVTSADEGGRALFFVWALEQQGSRRGWGESDGQDVMVPWVSRAQSKGEGETRTFHRYYHLYRRGEIHEDIVSAGGEVLEHGYDRDNWWAIASKKKIDPEPEPVQ